MSLSQVAVAEDRHAGVIHRWYGHEIISTRTETPMIYDYSIDAIFSKVYSKEDILPAVQSSLPDKTTTE
jgi:hypothetical protein